MTPDKLREEAFREFEKWFIANYPGPETIISDPAWHAPKIFRSATHRLDKAHAAALEEIERLKAERDAAFAMSKCECESSECCANLVKAHERAEQAERRAERLEAEHYEALLIQKKKMQEVIDYWQGIAESRADKGG